MTFMKILIFLFLFATVLRADPGRIYTAPDPTAPGGIEGTSPLPLTHALAVERGRLKVYRASLDANQKAFRFPNLPVGKYDLVLVSTGGIVFEGLDLGEPPADPDPVSRENLEKRVAAADSFFNRHTAHRIGTAGDQALIFVERIRDRTILKQSGEKLDANLRRFEIIELARAADDWQMTTTRHIYREEEPVRTSPAFMKHFFVSTIGNLRIVDTVKQLGALALPTH